MPTAAKCGRFLMPSLYQVSRIAGRQECCGEADRHPWQQQQVVPRRSYIDADFPLVSNRHGHAIQACAPFAKAARWPDADEQKLAHFCAFRLVRREMALLHAMHRTPMFIRQQACVASCRTAPAHRMHRAACRSRRVQNCMNYGVLKKCFAAFAKARASIRSIEQAKCGQWVGMPRQKP